MEETSFPSSGMLLEPPEQKDDLDDVGSDSPDAGSAEAPPDTAEAPEPIERVKSPEEIAERSKMFNVIQQYKDQFPQSFETMGYSLEELNDMGTDLLHVYVSDLKARHAARRSFNVFVRMLDQAVFWIENIGITLGVNIEGFQQKLTVDNKEEWDEIKKELVMKYANGRSISVELQCVMLMGTVAFQLHQSNTSKKQLAAMSTGTNNSDFEKELSEIKSI